MARTRKPTPAATPVATVSCVVCGSAPALLLRAGVLALCRSCALGQVQAEPGSPPQAGWHAQMDAMLPHLVPLAILILQQCDDATFAATWQAWLVAPEATNMFDEVLPTGDGNPTTRAQRLDTLSKALAALAFVPGGVPFAGRRYVACRNAATYQTMQEDSHG